MKELWVPEQSIREPLIPERAGAPFKLLFPLPIPEQPRVGYTYKLSQLALTLQYSVVLKVGQEEAFPANVNCSLELLRNEWTVGVWPLSFQMRLAPGTEGKKWLGQATVYEDLNTSIDYRSGELLKFAVSGVVPGNIGAPQLTKQEQREIAQEEREIERDQRELDSLQLQGEMVERMLSLELAQGESTDGTWTLLEEIRNRLFEME